ncbi:MAG: hypothetical protein ACLT29_02570 [Ruminococcus callidus]
MTGICAIDGVTYYADANGVMQTGLQEINGSYYYFNEETGALQTGWVEIAGARFYLTLLPVPCTQDGWRQRMACCI